jgi:NAD(P)-dependent dehydrogenase (short-subunit alcohol dehydrogenase family)
MDLTEADWDRILRVNSKGVFFCLQRAAREMIPRRSGHIINIASIAGKGFAGTSNAIYAASKGAVISLTKTAARLDPKSGDVAQRWAVAGPVRSQPEIEGGWIYVGTENGRLVGIDTKNPEFAGWATWGDDAARTGAYQAKKVSPLRLTP